MRVLYRSMQVRIGPHVKSLQSSQTEQVARSFNDGAKNWVNEFVNCADSGSMHAAVPAPEVTDTGISTRFVGRQPILDLQKRVYGYELLFRAGMENCFSGDSDGASRQIIDNVMLLGMETIAPGAKAFVNSTRETLLSGWGSCLPMGTVVEVLETVEVDHAVIDACIDLKAQGYKLALDDFEPGRGSDLLVEHADYIKLDFRACDTQRVREIQRQLDVMRKGSCGAKVALVAEKVETAQEFTRAVKDGFQYFQGYFFARPTIVRSREIPANQMLYFRLLSAVSRTPTNLTELEGLISAETSLCYRVLRMVNSAGMGMRTEVTSVRQALVVLGEDQLRKLVTVAMATNFGKKMHVSRELILLSLQRARFCELIAPAAHESEGEQYLIGMVSAVGAILRTSMEQLLELLPLRGEAAGTLMGKESSVSLPYQLLQAYERADWDACRTFKEKLHLTELQVSSMYVSSLQWAAEEIRDAGM